MCLLSNTLLAVAGQGGITVPGSIGATPIEAPIDIEEGLPVEVPLVYFFGHATPADHSELYKLLVERLASLLDRRAKSSVEVSSLRYRLHFNAAQGSYCHL